MLAKTDNFRQVPGNYGRTTLARTPQRKIHLVKIWYAYVYNCIHTKRLNTYRTNHHMIYRSPYVANCMKRTNSIRYVLQCYLTNKGTL